MKNARVCVAALATIAVAAVPFAGAGTATAASDHDAASSGKHAAAAKASKKWKLSYSTDFKSLSGWTVYNGQTQSNDNSVNLSKNVTTGGNGLTIKGKRESGYSMPFTTGEIVGKGAQVVPNYFKARVKGTFDDMQGVWPCLLWFRPNNANDGEIDVMEWMGGLWSENQKRVAITMHNEYGAKQDSAKKPLLLNNHSWYKPSASHVYTVKKVPGSLTVKVDGRVISKFTAADKSWWNRIMENENRTWYPRITLQIGSGSAVKTVPNPASGFKDTEMGVRSLQIWKYER